MVKILTKTKRIILISAAALQWTVQHSKAADYDCNVTSSINSLATRRLTTNVNLHDSITLTFQPSPPQTIVPSTPLTQALYSARPKADKRAVVFCMSCPATAGCTGFTQPIMQLSPTTNITYETSPLPGPTPGFKATSKTGDGTYNCKSTVHIETPVATWPATTNEPDTYGTKDVWWDESTVTEWTIHYDGNWSIEGVPSGTYTNANNYRARCTLRPLQLKMNITPEIDFGVTTAGTATSREMEISITSGTGVPSGTYTMTSPNANANDRINLGGGEVKIQEGTTEHRMGQVIPIISRMTRLNATLNATGATPGPAETHLTVTMTVD